MHSFKYIFTAAVMVAVMLASCKKDDPGGDSHTPVKFALADSCHVSEKGALVSKIYYSYNAYGMPVEVRRVKLDGDVFVNDSLVKRTFDKARNVLSEEKYFWKNGFWNTLRKVLKTYDAENRVLTEEYYLGYGDASTWKPMTKYEYGYGKDGLYEKHDIFKSSSGEWKLSQTQDAAIDSKTGLITTVTVYSVSSDVKTPSTKTDYERNEAGKVIRSFESVYDNSEFKLKYKTEMEYDALDNLTKEHFYAQTDGEWVEDAYHNYKYNGVGVLSESVFYIKSGSLWKEATLMSREFNEKGLVIKGEDKSNSYSYRGVTYISEMECNVACSYDTNNLPLEMNEKYKINLPIAVNYDRNYKFFNSIHTY